MRGSHCRYRRASAHTHTAVQIRTFNTVATPIPVFGEQCITFIRHADITRKFSSRFQRNNTESNTGSVTTTNLEFPVFKYFAFVVLVALLVE